MMDKMQRINSYAQQGKLEVADEKVEDTLMDLANYCILMSAYINREDARPVPERYVLKTRDFTTIDGVTLGEKPPEPGKFYEEYPLQD